MRRVEIGIATLVLSTSFACATTQPRGARSFQSGDATGQPSLEALPSLDVQQSELTPEMRMATMLSAEALDLDPPAPPSDSSTAAIAAWSDDALKSWMREKHKRAEAARKELDRAAEQSHRQRVMAGALVGLVYEDFARTLLKLPVPNELSSEPEIAAMYTDLLRTQAMPYLLQAHQAYVACSGNAEQLAALRHWSSFCGEREERLPNTASEPLGAGPTSVSVVRK